MLVATATSPRSWPSRGPARVLRHRANAVGFTLPGLDDYTTDVFFLLHAVATELRPASRRSPRRWPPTRSGSAPRVRGVAGRVGRPGARRSRRSASPSRAARPQALELLVAPVLAAADTEASPTPRWTRSIRAAARVRRIARFALLAAKLSLDATEVASPSPTRTSPASSPSRWRCRRASTGSTRCSRAATARLRVPATRGYWAYSPATTPSPTRAAPADRAVGPPRRPGRRRRRVHRRRRHRVDRRAATRRAPGSHSSGEPGGTPVGRRGRRRGGGDATPSPTPGRRIDAAFVDPTAAPTCSPATSTSATPAPATPHGRRGLPAAGRQWWRARACRTPLPAPFRGALDAAFQGHDGGMYLFAGDRYLAVADGPARPVVEAGRSRRSGAGSATPSTGAERVDAAYVTGSAVSCVAGDQVIRLLRLHRERRRAGRRRVPAAHRVAPARRARRVRGRGRGGVRRRRPAWCTCSRTAGRSRCAERGHRRRPTVPTAAAVGRASARCCPAAPVDAAFVGLDGQTYLFSGDTYLRYSGADYSVVDVGYPRRSPATGAGCAAWTPRSCSTATTYLFGAGGLLFDAAAEHAADLDAGRVSPALRQRLARHGLTLPDDTRGGGGGPEWRITTEQRYPRCARRREATPASWCG